MNQEESQICWDNVTSPLRSLITRKMQASLTSDHQAGSRDVVIASKDSPAKSVQRTERTYSIVLTDNVGSAAK